MRPRIQEPDPIRCFWRGTSFTNLLSTSLEFVGTIVGDLKEICSAPVRLLIVGGVGPVTEAMKGDSVFSPSHTFVQICLGFFPIRGHLQNIRGVQVNTVKSKLNSGRPRHLETLTRFSV